MGLIGSLKIKFNISYLFAFLLFGLTNGLKAQCDFYETITVSTSGYQSGAGYSQKYVLVDDASDLVIAINTTGIFTPAGGDYRIYAINYEDPQPSILAVNSLWSDISDYAVNHCMQYIGPYTGSSFALCDDVCNGYNIVVSASGYTATVGFDEKYVLVNAAGTILATNTTGIFTPADYSNTAGVYSVYAVNTDDATVKAEIDDLGLWSDVVALESATCFDILGPRYVEVLSAPTGAPTNLDTVSVDKTQIVISWTLGTGSTNTLVVIKEGSAPSDPVTETSYTASAAFGSGDDLGAGSYVVYNGGGTSVTVTSLNPGTTYYVEAWSLNGTCYFGTNINDNWTTDYNYLYVDDDANTNDIWTPGVTGVDGGGCGTTANPCRTVQYVFNNNLLTSADIIRVDAGTYVENDMDPANDDDNITIQGAGQTLTIFDPAGAANRCFVFESNSSITLKDFTIQNASKSADGVAIRYVENTPGTYSVKLNNITIDNCDASSIGYSGGGLYVSSTATVNVSVTNCEFKNNDVSGKGAGIYLDGGATSNTISKCIFQNNSSTSDGPAIYDKDGNTTITNCLFYENTFSDGTAEGIVHFATGTNEVQMCTFADNPANDDCLYAGGGTTNVFNSIFYGNTNGGAYYDFDKAGGASVNVDYCIYERYHNISAPTNSLTSNPLFVSAASDNYHLTSSSPAIDAGDGANPSTDDLDGAVRISPNEDMGCYEGDGCSSLVSLMTAASGINFTSVSSTSMTINWTRGNGAGVVVVVRESSSNVGDPLSYTDYSGFATDWSAQVGTASTDGGNSYIVYQGTGTNVTLTNLLPETTYYVEVWEYLILEECYQTSPDAGSQQTAVCDLVWTGATDSDWGTSTNWDLNTVPTKECSVTITTSGTAPIIDASEVAKCKNLRINSGATLTADMTSGGGGSYEIWGNIVNEGTFASGASLDKNIELHGTGKTLQGTGTFIDASPALDFEQVEGDMTLASDVALDDIVVTAGSFSLNTFNLSVTDLTLSGGTYAQNTGTTYIGGVFTTGGTFDENTGTTHFNGAVDQTIPSETYYDVIIDGVNSKTKTIGNGTTVIVSNNLTLQNPSTAGGEITTDDDVSIGSALNIGVTGNALTFNVTDNGRLYRATSGTGFTMGNDVDHQINVTYDDATNAFLSSFSDSPLQFYGTVTYNNGTATLQKVIAANYYNLTISGGNNNRVGQGVINVANDLTVNAGTFTLGGTTDVDDEVFLNGGTLSASSYTLYVGGDFVTAGGSFSEGTSTVEFDGGSTQYVNVTTEGGTTPESVDFIFYNLNIVGSDVRIYCDVSSYSVTVSNDLNISGTLKNIEK